MVKRTKKLERTAYHEAGHAVVARVLHRRFRTISIVPADEFEAALLAQERRDINDEIFRIDRKYQQVNLLKLIPIGINVVKKLWEAVKRKK